MSAALRILSAGPGATLQDGGRRGFLRFGVTGAGPMDPLAHATANLAVGAAANAAAIEVSLGGLELTAEGGSVTVAVAGGTFRLTLDDRGLPPATVVAVAPGARLSIRSGESGAWCYVAVAGRIDITPTLGSLATHTRSHLGGLAGRALVRDDLLPIASADMTDTAACALTAPWLDRPGDVIRVVLGPQDDYFAPEQIAAFFDRSWTVTTRADRMAYLLDGEPIGHGKGFNIVSDGIALGAIQVPGEGKPIVLMADRQPTGGYPKIATIIGTDLGRFAQLRPGATFRFVAASLAEAVAARRAEQAALAGPIALTPLVRTDLSSEFLLGLNLIDGVVSAGQPLALA
ncbi:MAG: biotin-dependent carboxyltransferase family protein [Rhizobiales bacterium]|nr:biotin-dependent carboxyltransferase family protein [Hyphomicrobiales bacterium]